MRNMETNGPNETNQLELVNVQDNQEKLLRITGKVNGHPAKILIDSEATRNFVAEKFVEKNSLQVNKGKH